MASPVPKSVLCLDLGTKRIGLAGCDPLGLTVTPLEPLLRTNFKTDIIYLQKICDSRNIKGLIFGLPLDDDGLATEQSNYCKKLGIKIAYSLDLPLAWVNEHSSSWEAQVKFNLPNDRSGKLDSASATIILEQWLRDGPNLQFVS